MASGPNYVYVASSWRNAFYPAVIATLRAAKIDHYDFRNPPGRAGFGWEQVTGSRHSHKDLAPGERHTETIDSYLDMMAHPLAAEGYAADREALDRADAVILVLPCGKSAHLELGIAVGAGKRTAILLEEPMEPDLMYMAVDRLSPDLMDLLAWLGVED